MLPSLPPLNLRQAFQENLFDNNSRYEDYECDSACANHRRRGKSYQQMKSQNDCTSPEFPLESRADSRVPARVCNVEAAQFVRKKHIWLFRWNRMDPALAVSYPDYGSCVHLRIARSAGALKRSCCAPPSRDSNTEQLNKFYH